MRGTERLVLYKILLFFFLISVFSIAVSAQNFLPAQTDSLITNGMNSIILQNYDDAENYFNELDSLDKIDPLGKIYLTVVSISKSFDLGEEYKWDYISNLLEEAKKIAEENYDQKPKSVLRLYTLALAEGYYAYVKGLESNWISAISNGYNAIKNFERCVMMDSTFYEAYTAIGTFKYWKSKKGSFLPMISDERDLGVKYLELAVVKSRHSNYLAVNSLLWIYIDKKEFQKTINLANEILSKYPQSRLFKWALARAYESIDMHKSISVYKQILNDYESMRSLNGYQKIVLLHLIAQLENRLGNKKAALDLCNVILNMKNLSEFVLDELDNRLDRVKSLRVSLLNE
ncbi:MAG: hypothetical protein IIA48_10025 [Bacteroidetes bacterium]|nr:hypothetical protein [Bacteroidota bacterium]